MALAHIEAVVPKIIRHAFDHPDWIFEPKFDGFRGLLYIDGEERYFRSKKDKPLVAYDKLAENIRQELRVTAAVIDGEIAVLDPETGYSDFGALQRHQGVAVFMAFDLLRIGTQDLRAQRLFERKKMLRALIREDGWIKYLDHVDEQGLKFMDRIVAAGIEGMVAKQKYDSYPPRNKWLKVYNPNLKKQRKDRARMFAGFRAIQNA